MKTITHNKAMSIESQEDEIESLRQQLAEKDAEIARMNKPCQIPVPSDVADQIERTDWTPEQALQFYADQRNFDIVEGRARIIDNGAVASNALKHLTVARLELKGDTELTELRNQLAASQAYAQQLREALQTYIDEHDECTDVDDWMAMLCSIEAHHVADEALAITQDTTALSAMIAKAGEVMRERAMLSIQAGRDWGCNVEAIRALPGVTLEDLSK